MAEMMWKISGLYKADPNLVSDEIRSIGETATPERIVELAKNESSELHKCFEWNDSVAAEKYRLHQARLVMCNLVFVPAEPKQPMVREWQFLERESHYEQTKLIVQNMDKYTELLKSAKADLLAFKRKYQALTELNELVEIIDKIVA